jgi:hypothetical protein
MDYTFTQAQLEKPTATINAETNTLVINKVDHATQYKIYYVNGSIETLVKTVNAAAEGDTELALSGAFAEMANPGTYTLKIVASGPNYTDSIGTEVTYTVQ